MKTTIFESLVCCVKTLRSALSFPCVSALAIAAASITAYADPVLITFDDLATGSNLLKIPNGYKGISWVNFDCLDAVNYIDNPSGYQNGVISANNVAFLYGAANPGTTAMMTNGAGFDLLSAYMAAAWRDGLNVRVIGYSGATAIYDNTYILSTAVPTFISFNYKGVTHVSFVSSGGTRSPVLGSDGYHFLMDNVTVSTVPSITPGSAGIAFDQLWNAFETNYAMFGLRPEVDWNASRETFRPLATNTTSSYDLANVFVQMLKPLRDLHISLSVSGSYLPTFDDPRPLNANPKAYAALLGSVNTPNPKLQWAVTQDKIGFIAINSWTDSALPTLCHEALEQMRDTRGLIIDVRANGGGNESLARQVAGRFQSTNFVYAYYQTRNGPNHTDLTAMTPRTVSPVGPWRYDRPVILLIGQDCVSSDESFVGMMTGDSNVTTMGDHTRGASGNPKTFQLPFDITVNVPTWVDYLPDGSVLDGHGFVPQVPFTPTANSFTGTNDALLSTAMDRIRSFPVPPQPILGPVFRSLTPLTFDDLTINKDLVSPGYGGLTWSNLYVYNAVTNPAGNLGFLGGMSSSPNILYNGYGSPASISASAPFDLLSAVLAAAFNSNLNLKVTGYVGTQPTYERTLTLNPFSPETIQFDFYGVTSVSFVSSGGTPYYYSGTQFVLDDLVVAPHDTTVTASPLLKVQPKAGAALSLSWSAQAGRTYQLQYTGNLSNPTWTNLGVPLMTGNYTLTSSDPCTNQQRFYRVIVSQ